MQASFDSPRLKILHVLTLNGRNGEYGGPVRVARELCAELRERGHQTHIFSGALKGAEPIVMTGDGESFILVKPIAKKLAFSSLWSWKLVAPLSKLIKSADVIHIHFARDLVPFLAALLSIIKRKHFVTQTHGMILPDGRKGTQLVDLLLTKPLINKSETNLILTESELVAVNRLGIKSPSKILQNGIAIKQSDVLLQTTSKRIVFCSRLEKRKGVQKFIELAESFRETDFCFEIYGPDGGELNFVLSEIINRNLQETLIYKGALQSDRVQDMLADTKLLILPSRNEPFPMIVLESLAVGTPVLVMPSCGFAKTLKKFDQSFVSRTETTDGLIESFKSQMQNSTNAKSRTEIRQFCSKAFGIASVTDDLEKVYGEAVKDD